MLRYDREEGDLNQADLLVHTKSHATMDKFKITQDQGPSHQQPFQNHAHQNISDPP